MLARTGPVSQSVLAEEFDVTSGSMSTMTERLLKLDLIERSKNPKDLRCDLISITPKGTNVLKGVRDVWQDIDELIEQKLGAEKAKQLIELTRELKVALGGKVPGAGLRQDANRPMERT